MATVLPAAFSSTGGTATPKVFKIKAVSLLILPLTLASALTPIWFKRLVKAIVEQTVSESGFL